MVLEQFLESSRIKQHKFYIFLLGFVYVFISYLVAKLFFPQTISIAMLFLCSLLLVPSLYMIINYGESIERKHGLNHFFYYHKDLFEIYLFLFLGVFIGYLVLGANVDFNNAFSYQLDFLETNSGLSEESASDSLENGYEPSFSDFTAVLSHNVLIIVIAFVLSIFYGVGAIFLITLNASVFSAFFVYIMNYMGSISTSLLFLVHLVPELAGFIAAAIAGGVVSRAIVKEKIGSKGFRNVMKDSAMILLIAFILILIAALLEVFVTSQLI